MKKLLTKRAMLTWVVAIVVLVAVNSLAVQLSDGSVSLASPVLVLVIAAALALITESVIQARRK